jgi:hypothetical protein
VLPAAVPAELDDLDGEPALGGGRSGVEGFHRLVQAVAGSGRAEYGECLAAAGELTVQDQEGQPAEVIAVQVAEHDRVDLAGVEVLGFHRGQAGGPAVNQHGVVPGLQADAGLEPAPVAEGISAADEVDLHSPAPWLPGRHHTSP